MAEFFKYGKDGQNIDLNTFKAKFDLDKAKIDTNAKKLFNIFDEDGSGEIDTDSEKEALYKAFSFSANKDNNPELSEIELTQMLDEKLPEETPENKQNILTSIKNIFTQWFNSSQTSVTSDSSTDVVDNTTQQDSSSQETETPIDMSEIQGANENVILVDAEDKLFHSVVTSNKQSIAGVREENGKVIVTFEFEGGTDSENKSESIKYLVDVISDSENNSTEYIVYDTDKYEDIKNGTATKRYREVTKDGKTENYILFDGTEYTEEEYNKLQNASKNLAAMQMQPIKTRKGADGQEINTVKIGKYLVDITKDPATDVTEQIYYDTQDINAVTNGTATKKLKLVINGDKKTQYVYGTDGKWYTVEQAKAIEAAAKKQNSNVLAQEETPNGDKVYFVKQDKHIIKVIQKKNSNETEEIYYNTDDLAAVRSNSAEKVRRIVNTGDTKTEYFVDDNGNEQTIDQILRTPLENAASLISKMISPTSNGMYRREGNKIYKVNDDGTEYLAARISGSGNQTIRIYSDTSNTHGWDYIINDLENPIFEKGFIIERTANGSVETGYGWQRRIQYDNVKTKTTTPDKQIKTIKTQTTNAAGQKEIMEKIYDDTNTLITQITHIRDSNGQSIKSVREDFGRINTRLEMVDPSKSVDAIYTEGDKTYKLIYKRDDKGNIIETKQYEINPKTKTSKEVGKYTKTFDSIDNLPVIDMPFDANKGAEQYKNLDRDLYNNLCKIYGVCSENTHKIYCWFASLTVDEQKKINDLFNDPLHKITNEIELRNAISTSYIVQNDKLLTYPFLPKEEEPLTEREQVLQKRRNAVQFLLNTYDQAISLLQAHLDDMKSNMFTNIGEIIVEDIRFYSLSPFRAAYDALFTKNNKVDSGTLMALKNTIYREIEKLYEMREECTKLLNSTQSDEKFNEVYKRLTGGMTYSQQKMDNYQEKCKQAAALYQKAIEAKKKTIKIGNQTINIPDINTEEYKAYKKYLDEEVTDAYKSIVGNVQDEASGYIGTSAFLGGVVEAAIMIYATYGAGAVAEGASIFRRVWASAKVMGTYTALRLSANMFDELPEIGAGEKSPLGVLIGEENANAILSGKGDITFDDWFQSRGGQVVWGTGTSFVFGAVAGATSKALAKGATVINNFLEKNAMNTLCKAVNIGLMNKKTFISMYTSATISGKTEIASSFSKFCINLFEEIFPYAGVMIGENFTQTLLSENGQTELAKAIQEGNFLNYILDKLKEQGLNLFQVKSIGIILQMLLVGRGGAGGNFESSALVKEYYDLSTKANPTAADNARIAEIQGSIREFCKSYFGSEDMQKWNEQYKTYEKYIQDIHDITTADSNKGAIPKTTYEALRDKVNKDTYLNEELRQSLIETIDAQSLSREAIQQVANCSFDFQLADLRKVWTASNQLENLPEQARENLFALATSREAEFHNKYQEMGVTVEKAPMTDNSIVISDTQGTRRIEISPTEIKRTYNAPDGEVYEQKVSYKEFFQKLGYDFENDSKVTMQPVEVAQRLLSFLEIGKARADQAEQPTTGTQKVRTYTQWFDEVMKAQTSKTQTTEETSLVSSSESNIPESDEQASTASTEIDVISKPVSEMTEVELITEYQKINEQIKTQPESTTYEALQIRLTELSTKLNQLGYVTGDNVASVKKVETSAKSQESVENSEIEQTETAVTVQEMGSTTQVTYDQMFDNLKKAKINHCVKELTDGRKLITIYDKLTKKSDYYEFDKDGNLINIETQINEKEAKTKFSDFEKVNERYVEHRHVRIFGTFIPPVWAWIAGVQAHYNNVKIRHLYQRTGEETDLELQNVHNDEITQNEIKDIIQKNTGQYTPQIEKDITKLYKKWLKNNKDTIKHFDAVFKNIKNLDFEHLEQHLKNIKTLFTCESNNIVSIVDNGYFSSQEGAEAFAILVGKYSTIAKSGHASPLAASLALYSVHDVMIAKERGLLEKLDNYTETSKLLRMSDEEYNAYKEKSTSVFEQTGKTFEELNNLLFDKLKTHMSEQNIESYKNNALINEENVVGQLRLLEIIDNLPVKFKDGELGSVLREINNINIDDVEQVFAKLTNRSDITVDKIESLLSIINNKTCKTICELLDIEDVTLDIVLKYCNTDFKNGKVSKEEIINKINNDSFIQTTRAIKASTIDLKPTNTTPTELNPRDIKTSSLALVHMTDYIPENGTILSTRDKINGSRNSVHFTLNHAVSEHALASWNSRDYAIIMPYESTVSANTPHKFIEGMPNDIYTDGSVTMPEGTVIIKYNENIEKGSIKITTDENMPGVKIIETSEAPHSMVPAVLAKMGYSNIQGDGPMGLFSYGEKNGNTTSSAVANYTAWKTFCTDNNIRPANHTASPNGIAECLIEDVDRLCAFGKWKDKNHNYKENILSVINRLKVWKNKGYFISFDLDAFYDIINESSSPKQAREQIEKTLGFHPTNKRSEFSSSDVDMPMDLYENVLNAFESDEKMADYLRQECGEEQQDVGNSRNENSTSKPVSEITETAVTVQEMGSTTQVTYDQMFNNLKKAKINYNLQELSDGRKLITINDNLTKKSDYYEFDKDGKLTKVETQISEKDASSKFSDFDQVEKIQIENRGVSELPINKWFQGIKDYLGTKNLSKDLSTFANLLSDVDAVTKNTEINQANYNPLVPEQKEVLSNSKVQKNVGQYLDELIASNPELNNIPVTMDNILSIKNEIDYILPDGTVVALKPNSVGQNIIWNTSTQKYEVNMNENPEIILWIKDVNGEEHILPAFSGDNIIKAQKILNYMATIEECPRDQIATRQQEAIVKRNGLSIENEPTKKDNVQTLEQTESETEVSTKYKQKIENNLKQGGNTTLYRAIEANLEKITDPKLLELINDYSIAIKESTLPGYYKQNLVTVVNDFVELEKFKASGYESLSQDMKNFIEFEVYFTSNTLAKQYEAALKIEDETERTEAINKLDALVGSRLLNKLSNDLSVAVSKPLSEIQEDYVFSRLSQEDVSTIKELQNITGKLILFIPDNTTRLNSKFLNLLEIKNIRQWSNLSQEVKDFYIKNKDILLKDFEYIDSEKFNKELEDLTPEERKVLQNRVQHIDLRGSMSLKELANLDESTLNKCLEIQNRWNEYQGYVLNKYTLSYIKDVLDNCSEEEIANIDKRNLINLQVGTYYHQHKVHEDIVILLSKLTDAQWEQAKKIGLIPENNILNLDFHAGFGHSNMHENIAALVDALKHFDEVINLSETLENTGLNEIERFYAAAKMLNGVEGDVTPTIDTSSTAEKMDYIKGLMQKAPDKYINGEHISTDELIQKIEEKLNDDSIKDSDDMLSRIDEIFENDNLAESEIYKEMYIQIRQTCSFGRRQPVKDLKTSIQNVLDKYKETPQTKEELTNAAIDEFLDTNKTRLAKLATFFDKESIEYLLRKRINDTTEYLEILDKLNYEDLNIIKNLSQTTKADGTIHTPEEKIEFIDLIAAYKNFKIGYSEMESMISDGKVDISKLHRILLDHIFKQVGMTEAEIASIPEEKINAWDIKYIHLLAKEMEEAANDSDNINHDSTIWADIIKASSLGDFMTYIHDESNIYGQTNAKTRQMYEQEGADYQKWINPSKEHEVTFKATDTNKDTLQQAYTLLLEDLNTLLQSPIGKVVSKRLGNYYQNGKITIPDEIRTNKTKLENFINNFISTMQDAWDRAENNKNNPQRAQNAQQTLTIYDHLKQRLNEVQNSSTQGKTKDLDLTIKMIDRVPQKDYSQGNRSTCCIGAGGGNGDAMPHYLTNTSCNMIEIVDNNTGKPIGNALCYMVKGADGKLAFVIDNIEISNSEKPSLETGRALRDAIAQYAKNVGVDVTKNPDVKVYMSECYNDVPIDDLDKKEEKVSFLGDIDCEELYFDLFSKPGEWTERTNLTQTVKLRELNSKTPDNATVVKTQEIETQTPVTPEETTQPVGAETQTPTTDKTDAQTAIVAETKQKSADTKPTEDATSQITDEYLQTLIEPDVFNFNGGRGRQRFDAGEIARLVELGKESPEIVQKLLNAKKVLLGQEGALYNCLDIEKLVALSKDNPKLYDYIVEQNNGLHSNELALIEASKLYPELTSFLISERTINSKGEDVPKNNSNVIIKTLDFMYNNREIIDKYNELLQNSDELNKHVQTTEITDEYLQTFTMDDLLNDSEMHIFSSKDRARIIELAKENPRLINILLQVKEQDLSGKEVLKYKFINEIEQFVNLAKENQKLVEFLIEQKVDINKAQQIVAFTKQYPFVLGTEKQNTTTIDAQQKQVSEMSEAELIKKSDIQQQLHISTKVFDMPNPDAPSVNKVYYDKPEKYFDEDNGIFKPGYSAQKIPTITPPTQETIMVSNFDEPGGTIAATSTLDKPIATEKLFTCAGLAIVDRANNKQTLIHCFSGQEPASSRQIIEFILSQSETKDLEISIIPGRDRPTACTVEFLAETINELAPDAKINYLEFPKEKDSGVKVDDRAVVIHNGNVYCCNSSEIKNTKINPEENITYCEPVKSTYKLMTEYNTKIKEAGNSENAEQIKQILEHRGYQTLPSGKFDTTTVPKDNQYGTLIYEDPTNPGKEISYDFIKDDLVDFVKNENGNIICQYDYMKETEEFVLISIKDKNGIQTFNLEDKLVVRLKQGRLVIERLDKTGDSTPFNSTDESKKSEVKMQTQIEPSALEAHKSVISHLEKVFGKTPTITAATKNTIEFNIDTKQNIKLTFNDNGEIIDIEAKDNPIFNTKIVEGKVTDFDLISVLGAMDGSSQLLTPALVKARGLELVESYTVKENGIGLNIYKKGNNYIIALDGRKNNLTDLKETKANVLANWDDRTTYQQTPQLNNPKLEILEKVYNRIKEQARKENSSIYVAGYSNGGALVKLLSQLHATDGNVDFFGFNSFATPSESPRFRNFVTYGDDKSCRINPDSKQFYFGTKIDPTDTIIISDSSETYSKHEIDNAIFATGRISHPESSSKGSDLSTDLTGLESHLQYGYVNYTKYTNPDGSVVIEISNLVRRRKTLNNKDYYKFDVNGNLIDKKINTKQSNLSNDFIAAMAKKKVITNRTNSDVKDVLLAHIAHRLSQYLHNNYNPKQNNEEIQKPVSEMTEDELIAEMVTKSHISRPKLESNARKRLLEVEVRLAELGYVSGRNGCPVKKSDIIQKEEDILLEKQKAELDKKIKELPECSFKTYIESLKYMSTYDNMLSYDISRYEKIVDLYNEIQTNISSLSNQGIIVSIIKKALEGQYIVGEDVPAIVEQTLEEYRLHSLPKSKRFMEYLKAYDPTKYEELQKSPEEINSAKLKELKLDYEKLLKNEGIIDECQQKAGTAEADALYEKYLQDEFVSSDDKASEQVKDICRQINRDFGVKVFLPSNLKEAEEGLKLVYQELACFKKTADEHGTQVKFPLTLDFYTSNLHFEQQIGLLGFYSTATHSITLRGLSIDNIKTTLRHELTHANDLKYLENFPEGFDPKKYTDVFRYAYIHPDYITYGQKNPKEFIAVAMQGDITKYPQELKDALISMGLPEWMLDMPNTLTKEDFEKYSSRKYKKYDD